MSKARKDNLNLQTKWYILELLLTAGIGVIISLLLVLISAFIIITFNLSSDIMTIFTTAIKIISIFVAGIFCLKRPNNGWLRGAIFGIIYTILAFLIFSLLDGEFLFSITILNDVAMGMIAGLITGIVAVNLRKT